MSNRSAVHYILTKSCLTDTCSRDGRFGTRETREGAEYLGLLLGKESDCRVCNTANTVNNNSFS